MTDRVLADISSVVVSLPHRGRLSMLCDPDLLDYSPAALFSKIKGQPEFDPETAPGATGDVISHLSAIKTQEYDGKGVKIEVLQNPSHLEVRQCHNVHLPILTSPFAGREWRCSWSDTSKANVPHQIISCGLSTW